MSPQIAVVGSSGRVGSALCRFLQDRYTVRPVARTDDEAGSDLASRAVVAASVVINAAGVAHAERIDDAVRARLREGNVELPLALASAALSAGVALVHISSVKAATPDESPYAMSKRDGEEMLQSRFGAAFGSAGLSLVVIRPPALLFPPLDAGKVSGMRLLRYWPSALTPPLRLPVLAPATFLEAVAAAIESVLDGRASLGYSLRDFTSSDRGTLRDVQRAFKHQAGTPF